MLLKFNWGPIRPLFQCLDTIAWAPAARHCPICKIAMVGSKLRPASQTNNDAYRYSSCDLVIDFSDAKPDGASSKGR